MSFNYIFEVKLFIKSIEGHKNLHLRPVTIIWDNFEEAQDQKSGKKSIETGQRVINTAI